ncbi:MAG: hypothetical protein ACYDD5_00610 [Sulfuricurvum sp.]
MNITQSNSIDIMKELQERIYDIPFDNSQFQNENFIINSALTPERAYRSAALRLQSRLEALKEASFNKRKNDIKIKKIQRKLDVETDDLEIELLKIEIEEIVSAEGYSNKLINDAIVESQQLYNFIQSCPKYTREDFEKAERTHFEMKLIEEVRGVTGVIKALSDMGVDLVASEGQPKLIYKENKDELLLR